MSSRGFYSTKLLTCPWGRLFQTQRRAGSVVRTSNDAFFRYRIPDLLAYLTARCGIKVGFVRSWSKLKLSLTSWARTRSAFVLQFPRRHLPFCFTSRRRLPLAPNVLNRGTLTHLSYTNTYAFCHYRGSSLAGWKAERGREGGEIHWWQSCIMNGRRDSRGWQKISWSLI